MPPIETVSVRAGTTAEWADTTVGVDGEASPILALGEVGIDVTTGRHGRSGTAPPPSRRSPVVQVAPPP